MARPNTETSYYLYTRMYIDPIGRPCTKIRFLQNEIDCKKKTNLIAKTTNLIAKRTNLIAKTTNLIAKRTNLIAKTTN